MTRFAPITIRLGETFQIQTTVRDPTRATVGKDLTGATTEMKIRNIDYDGAVLSTLSATTDATGVITLILSAVNTAALRASLVFDDAIPARAHGVYDLELLEINGTKTRILEGPVIFLDEATR